MESWKKSKRTRKLLLLKIFLSVVRLTRSKACFKNYLKLRIEIRQNNVCTTGCIVLFGTILFATHSAGCTLLFKGMFFATHSAVPMEFSMKWPFTHDQTDMTFLFPESVLATSSIQLFEKFQPKISRAFDRFDPISKRTLPVF